MTETGRISQRAEGADLGGEQVSRVFLLTGGVRRTPLEKASNRSGMLLPISDEQTVLDDWLARLAEGFGAADRVPPVEVVGPLAPERSPAGVEAKFEADPSEFRGTAGLLRDLTAGMDPEEWILAASGKQILSESLPELLWRMHEAGGDLVTVSISDGTPTLLLLARAKVFSDVSPIGYVDLKEQALGRIARQHEVRVVQWDQPIGLNIRTRGEYLAALRRLHKTPEALADEDPFREDWQSCFTIVEEGAEVSDEATTHDSVILSGARVAAGAAVIRSVVGPGARVGSGDVLTDQVAGVKAKMRGLML